MALSMPSMTLWKPVQKQQQQKTFEIDD